MDQINVPVARWVMDMQFHFKADITEVKFWLFVCAGIIKDGQAGCFWTGDVL